MKNETIRCAAIHFDSEREFSNQPEGISSGFVVAGYSHDTIRSLMVQLWPHSDIVYPPDENEGFLTSCNRFVSRKEAYRIAVKMRQILHPKNPHRGDRHELTHDDLY